MKKMVLGKLPSREFPLKSPLGNPTPPPGKLPPRNFSPGIFPPTSLIPFLHLTLCFDKFSQM